MSVEIHPQPGALAKFGSEFSALWRALPNKGLFFGLLAAWLALFHVAGNSTFGYYDTPSLLRWLYLAYTQEQSEDGLGLVMPVVVLGLLWWKRGELLALPRGLWWPGLAGLAAALFTHVAGYMIQQPRVSAVALLTGVYFLVGLVFGRAWLRAISPPFVLLGFCVPVSSLIQSISFPLRLLATQITAGISQHVLGIHIVREGTKLLDANGTYQYDVDVACSGIRSLVAIFALALIYGCIALRSNRRRALMVAAAFPLAIAGNVFRLTSIILAAEVFGRGAGNFVHEQLGLLPYLPAFAGVMLLGHWLRERKASLPLEVGLA